MQEGNDGLFITQSWKWQLVIAAFLYSLEAAYQRTWIYFLKKKKKLKKKKIEARERTLQMHKVIYQGSKGDQLKSLD